MGRRKEAAAIIKASGLSANACITQRFFGGRRSSYPPKLIEALASILAFLGPIRDLTREWQTKTQEPDCLIVMEQIRDLLFDIRNEIFRISGRKP